MKSLFFLVLGCLFVSCEASAPSAPISDPEGYVLEQVAADLSRCYQNDANYCVDGDLNAQLGATMKSMHIEELPTKKSKLDKVAQRMSMRIKTDSLDVPVRRAELEKKIAARFHAPISKTIENMVFADFGSLPGTFEKSRLSYRLVTNKELLVDLSPTGKVVADAILPLLKKHPDAEVVFVRFNVHTNSDRALWMYSFDRSGGLMESDGSAYRVSGKTVSPDLVELKAGNAWRDDLINCTRESPPEQCKTSVPLGAWDDLE